MPAHEAQTSARWAARLIAAACLLPLLAACGGGDADEPDQPTPAVDCAARPELCK